MNPYDEEGIKFIRIDRVPVIENTKNNDVSDPQKMAIEMYGKEHQTMIAIEEMSELIKELSKDYRGNQNHDQIVEEMADVHICLEQLQMMFNISDKELDDMVEKKMQRNHERLVKELIKKWKQDDNIQ